jgi:esterase/lipase superfamily enzyme
MLKNQSGAAGINLIAHSMGNLALMEVIRDINLARGTDDKAILFNQIILAAPDIDRDLFLSLAQQMKGVAARMTLYASSNDLAMQASRTWAGSVPRAGDVPEGGPLLSDVIDTIDASAISTSMLALNHSGYAEDRVLLNDIGVLWRWGEPPNIRSSILRPVPAEGQPRYWQFH